MSLVFFGGEVGGGNHIRLNLDYCSLLCESFFIKQYNGMGWRPFCCSIQFRNHQAEPTTCCHCFYLEIDFDSRPGDVPGVYQIRELENQNPSDPW